MRQARSGMGDCHAAQRAEARISAWRSSSPISKRSSLSLIFAQVRSPISLYILLYSVLLVFRWLSIRWAQRVHRRIDAAGAGGRLKISYVHKGQRRENMMADALLRPFFQMGKGLPVLFQGNRGKGTISGSTFFRSEWHKESPRNRFPPWWAPQPPETPPLTGPSAEVCTLVYRSLSSCSGFAIISEMALKHPWENRRPRR